MKPCKACGQMIEEPATVCSTACYEEAYGETRAELYEDERHAFEPEEEQGEQEEEL